MQQKNNSGQDEGLFLTEKIQAYIEANHLLTNDKAIIVGLSGGADSVFLLHVLDKLRYKCIAAHCNFHLRGAESERDAEFCASFAKKLDIPFYKSDFDTTLYAEKEQISVEMAARKLRYNWFEQICEQEKAQAIAVAHHRDDSIETMILNMIRGTGIRGLSGISPKNGFIIRPLLCIDGNILRAYLKKRNLPYMTDSSNLSDEYTRNFIRLNVLPLMEKINPSVRKALVRTAEHLTEAEKIYTEAINRARKSLIEHRQEGNTHLSITKLMQQAAPKTVLFELLKPYGFTRSVCEDIFCSLNSISGKEFYAATSNFKILKDRNHLILYTPDNKQTNTFTVIAKKDKLSDKEKIKNDLPVRLSIRKATVNNSFKINKSPLVASMDFDKIKFPVTLRTWQPGDWFIPLGMKGRQKLSDYFSDHKFNRLEKEKTWVLCSGEDIIWIIGKRTDQRFCIDNKTKSAVIVSLV